MLDRSFAWMPAFIAVGLVAVDSVRRRRRFWPTLLMMLAFTYVGWLLAETLFPVPIDPRALAGMRQLGGSRLNLIPLATVRDALAHGPHTLTRQILGNVALFVPLGMLVPLLGGERCRDWKRVAAFALCTSLAIEVTQLAVSVLLRYGYRSPDIDDVWLNVTGALIGWAMWRLAATPFAPWRSDSQTARDADQ